MKEQVKFNPGSVQFYAGLRTIVMVGTVPHGNGTRDVRLDLSVERLTNLARLAGYVVAEPDREQHGHCLWHFDNPQREYPCEACSDAVKQAKEKWAKRVSAPAPLLEGNGPAAQSATREGDSK